MFRDYLASGAPNQVCGAICLERDAKIPLDIAIYCKSTCRPQRNCFETFASQWTMMRGIVKFMI